MIVDLCKPLNEGETPTVRIIMTVDEAREALAVIRVIGARKHDLLCGIQNAIARNDRVFDGKEAS